MPVGAASYTEGAALGRRDLPRAEEPAARAGLVDRSSATKAASLPTSPRTKTRCACSSRRSSGRATRPATEIAIALDPATSELYRDGSYELKGEGRSLRPGELAEYLGRAGSTATRSSRSRTAWPRTTGTAGAPSPTRWATACSSSATTCSSPTPSGSRWGSSGGRELDPHQGQPDRHAHRDARDRRARDTVELLERDVAPLGRDRGRDDRRPRGRDELRADQDRSAGPVRSHRRSTTSCCASRKTSASRLPTSAATRSRHGRAREPAAGDRSGRPVAGRTARRH